MVETLPAWQLARRTRIRESARTLLTDHAYADIQMRDVARQAGVALGTLYRYFPAKDVLYAEVVISWVDSHIARAGDVDIFPASRRLRHKIDVVARAYGAEPQYSATQQWLIATGDGELRATLSAATSASMAWLMEDLDLLDQPRRGDIALLLGAVMNEIVAPVVGEAPKPEDADRLADAFVGVIAGELDAAEAFRRLA